MPSKTAEFIEKVTKKVDPRKITRNKMLHPKRSSRVTEPPKIIGKKYNANVYEVQGRKCVNMKSADAPLHHIMYFHGGAYASQPSEMHWLALAWMMNKMPLEITFVNYPLSPEFTCRDTIGMTTEAYKKAFEKSSQQIILMGDSAGGGLALALAQYINAEKIEPQPDKLVLLSPWLDVSMDDEIPPELVAHDRFLDKDVLKIAGARYAGDIGAGDYRCSPIYGDLSNIGKIALFTGTHDILNIQARNLMERMQGQPGKIEFHEYADMLHVWMLIPMPEAEDAMEKVIEFIKK